MIAARIARLVAAFTLALGFVGASQAGPVLSSQVADNGTLTGPQTYTLQVGLHTRGNTFTDNYRFTLGRDWRVNEVSSYFNLGGGIQDFAVRLFSVAVGGDTLIASDLTPTVVGNTTAYSFEVPLVPAGDYRLEVTGKLVGLDYSGSLTLFRVPEPGGVALLATALFAMGVVRRKTRRTGQPARM
jgi:hypothetical protein